MGNNSIIWNILDSLHRIVRKRCNMIIVIVNITLVILSRILVSMWRLWIRLLILKVLVKCMIYRRMLILRVLVRYWIYRRVDLQWMWIIIQRRRRLIEWISECSLNLNLKYWNLGMGWLISLISLKQNWETMEWMWLEKTLNSIRDWLTWNWLRIESLTVDSLLYLNI